MIPTNRPVMGLDLTELAQKLGLSVMDACWVFGLNMPSWSLLNKKKGAEPVNDVCLALLVRYLDMYPESCPVEKATSPSDFYYRMAELNEKADPSERLPAEMVENFGFFGSILGRDLSAGYRWVRQSGGTRPVIDRYIGILQKDLEAGSITLPDLIDMTLVENKVRNIDSTPLTIEAYTAAQAEKEKDKKRGRGRGKARSKASA